MLCKSLRYGHCHRVLDFLLDPLSSCTYPGLTIATSSRNSRVMRSFCRLSLPVLRGLVPVWFRAVWTCATKTTTAHSCLLSWLPRAPLCCFLTTDRLADKYTTSIFHSRSSISLSISVSLSSTTHTTPQSFFLLPSAFYLHLSFIDSLYILLFSDSRSRCPPHCHSPPDPPRARARSRTCRDRTSHARLLSLYVHPFRQSIESSITYLSTSQIGETVWARVGPTWHVGLVISPEYQKSFAVRPFPSPLLSHPSTYYTNHPILSD